VRAATDIVALIGEHAALKRASPLDRRCARSTPGRALVRVNAEEGSTTLGCQPGDAIIRQGRPKHLDFVDPCGSWPTGRGCRTRDAEAGRTATVGPTSFDPWSGRGLVPRTVLRRARCGLPATLPALARYDGVVRQFGWMGAGRMGCLTRPQTVEPDLTTRVWALSTAGGRGAGSVPGRSLFPICDPSGRPWRWGEDLPPPPRAAPRVRDP